MTVILPYPPSANRYWRVVNGRPIVSKAAREYKIEAGWKAKAQGQQIMVGPVSVTIAVYRPQKRGDLDNLLKVILDALNGIAYDDDAQIVEIKARRFDDKSNPRVEIDVIEVAGY